MYHNAYNQCPIGRYFISPAYSIEYRQCNKHGHIYTYKQVFSSLDYLSELMSQNLYTDWIQKNQVIKINFRILDNLQGMFTQGFSIGIHIKHHLLGDRKVRYYKKIEDVNKY